MTVEHAIRAASAAIIIGLTSAASAQEASYHYDGDLRLSPETGMLDADWTLTVNDGERSELTLFLNAAFGEAEISGERVRSVSSRLVDGFNGPMRAYTVILDPEAEGHRREVRVRYAGALFPEPPETAINTLDTSKVEFTVDSFWLPFDAGFDALMTAELDVWLPGEWAGVAMQSIERVPGGFQVVQETPTLDLAFTLMADYQRHAAPGYAIYDTRDPAGANIGAAVAALDHCTSYLNTLSGPAGPLPDASIVVTSRNEGGYSRGTLIALTDIAESSEASLTQFICHELGHYWSHGNAMTVENWLNESFADYVAIMGMRDALGETAFEERLARYQTQLDTASVALPPVWTPATTERPPYLVAYRKGPLALSRAEALIGREAFERFIQAAMEARVSTTPQMLDVFEAVAGAEARTAFEAILAE
ncbi:M1 family aminopeptidase [Maricaulis sp. W15]|uniref:M1 family aminopeptidase n=1 Tax=Maricaulis sp. W15 TaxID=1772333 RepID=UPI000A748CCF|nr:M1 family aminopeptidase [Maricaulis sp. W15]